MLSGCSRGCVTINRRQIMGTFFFRACVWQHPSNTLVIIQPPFLFAVDSTQQHRKPILIFTTRNLSPAMIARRIYIKSNGSHVCRCVSIYLEHSHTRTRYPLMPAAWDTRCRPAHHQPCESFLSKMARYLSRLAFHAQSRTPSEQPVEAIWGSVSTAAAAPVADSVRVNNVDSHAQWRCASGVALHTKKQRL